MPKPKRSKREQIERYKRKLQDLEDAPVKNKRRRRFISSDESDYTEQGENHPQIQRSNSSIMSEDQSENEMYEVQTSQLQVDVHEPLSQPILEETEISPAPLTGQPVSGDPTPEQPALPAQSAPPECPSNSEAPAEPTAPVTSEPTLDPTVLAALGEPTSDTPEFGASIHDSLANIWQPLLRKGMAKDQKEKLLKEYLIPNNCKLLQAPKLNAEISAAVSEIARGRDKKYVAFQQQLGQGISAVNRAMDVLLKTDNKIEALKNLSDGCRILSDLHYFVTKDRKKLITPNIDKNFLHVIQDTERDESLFGNNLSEKIKASKAIERQGHQIKKSVSAPKASTSNTTSTRASTSQGNWSGPPRYSSNRGGRGGSRKTNPQPPTRRPYINTTVSTRPPAQSKPRAAPAHHQ